MVSLVKLKTSLGIRCEAYQVYFLGGHVNPIIHEDINYSCAHEKLYTLAVFRILLSYILCGKAP
jgi:hypothetical protein